MQKFLACSILSAATAQDCDICQGREIPEGAMTYDGHLCVETVPFCEDMISAGEMICGPDCATLQAMVGTPCCPPDEIEVCDICQGRPMLEGAVIDGVGNCADTIPFCNANTAACGATCTDLTFALGLPCCPPPPSGPCEICQGRPIADVILESGYSCADSIPFCNDNAAQCFGTCEELEVTMGAQCCPAPSDGSETSADGGSETGDAEASCDICQGRAIIDLILETGYSCADSIPLCVDNVAQCGGTCAEVQAALGTTCCPEAGAPTPAPTTPAPTTPAPTTPAPTTPAPTTPAPALAPTPALDAQPDAEEEDDDGFGSGAVTGAKATLSMFLVMIASRLLC